MHVQFVDVDGIRTRCLIAGDSERYPLLLLHGYGGTADVWIRNIDALGDRYYVVAADMISSGFTDPVDTAGMPPQPATIRHLRKLCDTLGFRRFCAMGTSYGGLMAALLHFDMPDRIDKLVLAGSGSCFNNDEQLIATFRKVLENFGPVMTDASIEGCRESMTKLLYDPASLPEEILPVMATAYAQPWMKPAWESGLRAMMDLDGNRPFFVRDRLEGIQADTLVVWGREDPGAIYASAVAGVARMPRAKLVTFEKCGHKPMFEHTARFNETVKDFLSGANL